MRIIINSRLLVPLLVIILNPWWWVIIQRNLWIGFLVLMLSFIIFLFFFQNKSRITFFLLLFLTAVNFLVIIKDSFDKNIFRYSALDIQQHFRRNEFYANGLGKLYKNRFSLTYFKIYYPAIYKLQSNLFSNLDPNLYFFSSHPRERLGVEEFKKYSPIFLPFFLLGALYFISTSPTKIFFYLIPISLLSSVISPFYNLGPILFFPFINLLTASGIIISFKRVQKYFLR